MSEDPAQPADEPLEAALSGADDGLRLNHWLPPQEGIVPRVRIGKRWVNVLWGVPIGVTALVVLIAIAQSLREPPSVQAFIEQYPGIAQSAPSVDSGFPWWLQLQHFVNMFFMLFIIRSGMQILADHPRLYWRRNRLVPFSSSCSERTGMDIQGRFRVHTWMAWDGLGFPRCATRSASPDGGTSQSICFG